VNIYDNSIIKIKMIKNKIFFFMNEFSLNIINQSKLYTSFVQYTNSTMQQKQMSEGLYTNATDQEQATESSRSCKEHHI